MRIGTRTIDHGPWSRASGAPPEPPHGGASGFYGDAGDHRAPLYVVWADVGQRVPLAVRDYDGCWALTTAAIDDRDIVAALLDFDQGGHVDEARIERTRRLLLGAEHWSHGREGTRVQG